MAIPTTSLVQTRREPPQLSLGAAAKAYVQLTKPRIVLLLLFTTITAMVIAANGVPTLALILPTIIGGALSAAGASAINQYVDRDMDAHMSRTAQRPIPSGRIAPLNALMFGLALIVASVLILGFGTNWTAAWLSLGGAFYYVIIYTMLLKRNTIANIVIGGGAGAFPVLVGWAVVTGTLSVEAWLLFLIVFYWTPPHSWALALLVNADYTRANVPMMPVARGERSTRNQILLYSVLLVIVTLLPVGIQMLGWIYGVAAVALGVGMIWMSLKLIRIADKATAKRTYKYSTAYLAFLFLAMMLDRIINAGF